MDVIIERKHWGRGQQDNPMKLWDSKTGKYDVIGAMLLKTGYDKCMLDGMRYPGPLSPDRRQPLAEPMEWLVSRSGTNTQECLAIIELNDGDMCDGDREQSLKQMVFAASRHRVELQFCEEMPIEVTCNSIYKMHRLGVNWEEFTRRVREDEIQTHSTYRLIERPLERAATSQYVETQHRVTRLFQPAPVQPPTQPNEYYLGDTVGHWPNTSYINNGDGWVPVVNGTTTNVYQVAMDNVDCGVSEPEPPFTVAPLAAEQLREIMNASEQALESVEHDSWWTEFNEETDESR